MWSCAVRAVHDDCRYNVVRYFPPNEIDSLPTLFLSVQSPEDWTIQTSSNDYEMTENLASEKRWLSSPVCKSVLSRCKALASEMIENRKNLSTIAFDLKEVQDANYSEAIPEELDRDDSTLDVNVMNVQDDVPESMGEDKNVEDEARQTQNQQAHNSIKGLVRPLTAS